MDARVAGRAKARTGRQKNILREVQIAGVARPSPAHATSGGSGTMQRGQSGLGLISSIGGANVASYCSISGNAGAPA
jgi:hypothetical protein